MSSLADFAWTSIFFDSIRIAAAQSAIQLLSAPYDTLLNSDKLFRYPFRLIWASLVASICGTFFFLPLSLIITDPSVAFADGSLRSAVEWTVALPFSFVLKAPSVSRHRLPCHALSVFLFHGAFILRKDLSRYCTHCSHSGWFL